MITGVMVSGARGDGMYGSYVCGCVRRPMVMWEMCGGLSNEGNDVLGFALKILYRFYYYFIYSMQYIRIIAWAWRDVM